MRHWVALILLPATLLMTAGIIAFFVSFPLPSFEQLGWSEFLELPLPAIIMIPLFLLIIALLPMVVLGMFLYQSFTVAFGKIEICIDGPGSYVFSGFFRFGKRRPFDWSEIEKIHLGVAGRSRKGSPIMAVFLETAATIEKGDGPFLTVGYDLIDNDRKQFLVDALNYLKGGLRY